MLKSINKKSAASLAACILATVGIAGQRVSVPPAAPGPFGAGANWSIYLGDAARTHYSRLTQVDKSNVARLRLAWSYDTGDRGEYQANNLVIDGVLFTASPTRKVIALNAVTGREMWRFDPATERPGAGGGRQRGLVYWANETGGEARLFTGVGNYLYALDLRTGLPIRDFADKGEKGFAPLTVGLVLASGYVMSRAADHDWRAYLLTGVCTLIFVFTKVNPLIVVAIAGFLGWMGLV